MNNKSNLEIEQQIRDILKNPEYLYNLRGRIFELIQFFDTRTLKLLGCDFVEHICWIIEENKKTYYPMFIRKLRAYLKKEMTEKDFEKVMEKFLVEESSYKIPHYPESKNNEFKEAFVSVTSLMLFNEQKKFKENEKYGNAAFKLFGLTKYADRAIHYYYGRKEDLESDDKAVVEAAKKRGREAAEKELLWQLDRIYEVYLEQFGIDVRAIEKEIWENQQDPAIEKRKARLKKKDTSE